MPCVSSDDLQCVDGQKRQGSMIMGWRDGVEHSCDSGTGDSSRCLDSQLWHACAGGMVQLPHVGSKVMYFPQGHAEHAAASIEFPSNVTHRSTLPCRVTSVQFLADTTDEVYARISLQPELGRSGQDCGDENLPSPIPPEKPVSFAKTLTQSDANNGGGFSVPRYCAETIFPRLDYSVDPPVQTVLVKDVHGDIWKFRHIYRGTPRRHLLTTGWSTFVNQKKLVAGDAIVFLRSTSGELCVGVRRSTRGTGFGDRCLYLAGAVQPAPLRQMKASDGSCDMLGGENIGVGAAGLNRIVRTGTGMGNRRSNFSRNQTRVTAKSVIEAASLAATGQPFNVIYYPRASISEFCVKAQTVRTALQQSWAPGMRYKMPFETEDSCRISWFMGTIAKVQDADPVQWSKSPWKMLQVTWDEPDLLQGVIRVSPWQVELLAPMQLPPFSLPKKKMRVSEPPELQLDNQGIMGLTIATLANNVLGHFNPWHEVTECVPAGIQGARHDRIYGLGLQDLWPKIRQGLLLNNSYESQDSVKVVDSQISTELHMGNVLHRESQNTNNSSCLTMVTVEDSSKYEPEPSGKALSWTGSLTSKSTPFLLFGKAINITESIKAQTQCSSGGSSEGPAHDNLSDGSQSEVCDKLHKVLSYPGNDSKQTDIPTSQLLHQGDSLDSASIGIGTLNWFKEQGGSLHWVNGSGCANDSITHCKVFRESEEVGRTVDLSLFDSYKDLYRRLSKMFDVEESEVLNHVMYTDFQGSSRHVGSEPYRDFMKKV
eukprot:c27473_g1_i3 orf=371-2668(+)